MIVDLIATDPFVRRLNLDTIKGEKDAFRYRIGDWRLVYRLDRETTTLVVSGFLPRGKAYD